MTRMTGPDCAVMCNLINIHTCIHTYIHTYLVCSTVDDPLLFSSVFVVSSQDLGYSDTIVAYLFLYSSGMCSCRACSTNIQVNEIFKHSVFLSVFGENDFLRQRVE